MIAAAASEDLVGLCNWVCCSKGFDAGRAGSCTRCKPKGCLNYCEGVARTEEPGNPELKLLTRGS